MSQDCTRNMELNEIEAEALRGNNRCKDKCEELENENFLRDGIKEISKGLKDLQKSLFQEGIKDIKEGLKEAEKGLQEICEAANDMFDC